MDKQILYMNNDKIQDYYKLVKNYINQFNIENNKFINMLQVHNETYNKQIETSNNLIEKYNNLINEFNKLIIQLNIIKDLNEEYEKEMKINNTIFNYKIEIRKLLIAIDKLNNNIIYYENKMNKNIIVINSINNNIVKQTTQELFEINNLCNKINKNVIALKFNKIKLDEKLFNSISNDIKECDNNLHYTFINNYNNQKILIN
jgi:hypothetical protein